MPYNRMKSLERMRVAGVRRTADAVLRGATCVGSIRMHPERLVPHRTR